MKKIKKTITAIISRLRKEMDEYNEIYREAYMDPNTIMMDSYMNRNNWIL